MRIRFLLLAAILGLAGCAGQYFKDAGPPPSPERHTLDAWPYREYWQGIVFNGARIGFAHLKLMPATDVPGEFDIQADAAFAFRLFGVEKKITLKARDRVNARLALVHFDYDFNLDGSKRRVRGVVRHNVLETMVQVNGRDETQSFPLAGPVYPMNALSLYPVQEGFAPSRQVRFTVFDGELMKLAVATQQVEGYETSDFFTGPAYKVRTNVHGHTTYTWFNAHGLPVFERALNGVLISALEDESRARRYLAEASLNKKEVMLEFSRVPVDRTISDPRNRHVLEVMFTGLDSKQVPAPDSLQQCVPEGQVVRCRVNTVPDVNPSPAALRSSVGRALLPTLSVPSDAPAIRETAARIVDGAKNNRERVARLVDWLQQNIRRKAVDVYTALDVLEQRQAECQGHSYLYAAFARSLGIPTRVVNGVVYVEDARGFLYHTWNESLIGTAWVPVDATFGQPVADATHVKLVEGETSADLLPLLEVIGRLKAKVIAYE